VKRIAQAIRHLGKGEGLEVLFREAEVRGQCRSDRPSGFARRLPAPVPRWSGC